MNRLEGKVALISGAAKGQGAEEVALFAAEGAQVIFGDILDDLGLEVEKKITSAGQNAKYMHLDVTNAQDWEKAIRLAESEYGTLDILVNNAGIALPQDYLDVSSEDWDRTMEINSKGVFLGIKYAVPAMQRAGGGSIVNISSIAGIVGRPLSSPAYAASKGAVRILTKSTAGRFASENIRCNSVHPGPINTDMIRSVTHSVDPESRVGSIPLGRIGESIDVAYGVLYLASDESSFVTGIELVIDGGVTGIRE
jgi:cyclopentanol dehydrogenase